MQTLHRRIWLAKKGRVLLEHKYLYWLVWVLWLLSPGYPGQGQTGLSSHSTYTTQYRHRNALPFFSIFLVTRSKKRPPTFIYLGSPASFYILKLRKTAGKTTAWPGAFGWSCFFWLLLMVVLLLLSVVFQGKSPPPAAPTKLSPFQSAHPLKD